MEGSMKINILELFGGICGFSKGLEQAGFEINKQFYSEIDKYAGYVTKYNYPDAVQLGSVTGVIRERIKDKIDIITFGSPCQDLSIAGKRKGLAGSRSGLFLEAIRIIREIRPQIFIWENVKGAYSSNDGRDFMEVLRQFANLGDYECEWQLLNTRWVLPQNRERIYLVGHLRGSSFGKVFPIGESHRRDYTKSINIVGNTKKGEQRGAILGPDGISTCLTSTDYKQPKPILLYQLGTIGKGGQANRVYSSDGISTTLAGEAGGRGAKTGLYCVAQRGRESGQELEPRKDNCTNSLTSVQKDNYIASQSRIRRLTPTECERLQGFPNGWTAKGINGTGQEIEISDTQRYKMCGNAITTEVVELIGRKLLS